MRAAKYLSGTGLDTSGRFVYVWYGTVLSWYF